MQSPDCDRARMGKLWESANVCVHRDCGRDINSSSLQRCFISTNTKICKSCISVPMVHYSTIGQRFMTGQENELSC